MGRALGYQGKSKSVRVLIRRYEAKDEASTVREIPPWIVRLAWMYGKYGVAGGHRPAGSLDHPGPEEPGLKG